MIERSYLTRNMQNIQTYRIINETVQCHRKVQTRLRISNNVHNYINLHKLTKTLRDIIENITRIKNEHRN